MSRPTSLTITSHPLPLLCRLWHRWGLDHHTWGWDYYECKRCGGRRAIGTAQDINDNDMDKLEFKWLKAAFKEPQQEATAGSS
jgi:hypothetical protein